PDEDHSHDGINPTVSPYDTFGGLCPTFIQINKKSETLLQSSEPMYVSKSSLAGALVVPAQGVLLRSDIPIFGVAGGEGFKSYRVEVGAGGQPTNWEQIEF